MRIVSWNCYEKFATNLPHLSRLGFDVAVVAECSPIEPTADLSCAFVQPIPEGKRHLGVFAHAPYSVRPLSGVEPSPWLLPMSVSGPSSFTLLGFWGVEPRKYGSYTSQLRQVIENVLPHVAGPVVLAGDLNAPIGVSTTAHAINVRLLGKQGLLSAFTATRGQGAEATEPTYYQWLRRGPPLPHRSRLRAGHLGRRGHDDGGKLRRMGRQQEVGPRPAGRRRSRWDGPAPDPARAGPAHRPMRQPSSA